MHGRTGLGNRLADVMLGDLRQVTSSQSSSDIETFRSCQSTPNTRGGGLNCSSYFLSKVFYVGVTL